MNKGWAIIGPDCKSYYVRKEGSISLETKEETANITWIDNDTVVINGYFLNVPKDKFDFRNQ